MMVGLSSLVLAVRKRGLFLIKKVGLIGERDYTKRYIKILQRSGVEIADFDIDSFISETVDFDGFDRKRIHIGKNVYLTNGVIILVHDQSVVTVYNAKNIGAENHGTMYAPADVYIGDNVFVGMRSIILPGTTIGDNVVIGAGSIVKGKIPSGTVWAGVPAKQITTVDKQYERLSSRGAFGVLDG